MVYYNIRELLIVLNTISERKRRQICVDISS